MKDINYLSKLSEYSSCLAYSMRMNVIEALIRNPGMCVNDLKILFDVRQPIMSRYLIDLKKHGFVYSKRSGKKRLYFVSKSKTSVIIAFAKISYNLIEHNVEPSEDIRF